ncbi:DMBT1 [Acanthosepion pharaonis]|uniref:DMBT1 n=1 Tax=Acanthosepion pharaonis TaxID=158019 RepID=A0A812CIZ5_ACAPH|nr:DMBT1 [Sepia pharaonis]
MGHSSITHSYLLKKEAAPIFIRIELVGGTSELSGRIEIIRNGIRGTVCDDSFDNNDANVICRMMGYSSGEVISNVFGQGQGTIWLDELDCTGSEYDLEVCPNLSWGVHDCTHREDVAVQCFNEASLTTSIPPTSNPIRIQLLGGSSEISGRIEITHKGIKGTVCDDDFDNKDAKVICRMMGYSSGEVIRNIFGEGQGTIWLDDLNCTGLEYDLEVCPNISWGTHNCQHYEDVAIKCFKDANTTTSIPPTSNDVRIQLIGGSSEISGRIEIIRNGVKGTVCDDQFDNNDAKVICRMIGYRSGEEIPNTFGQGRGVIWLDDLSCTGSEYDLEVCPNLSWGVHNCGHDEDVAIKCSTADQLAIRIQLIGGSSEISGRIEITRKGVKGTVCDDQFDNNDAKVICRMMGYSSGEVIPNIFGEGQGTIWLDDLSCTGLEYDLKVCPNISWGTHNCQHNEDVAIKCLKDANTTTSIPPTSNDFRIQLIGGSSEISGRIEITRQGVKGTVCDDYFDNNDAKVICRMMGYSSGEDIPNTFGEGKGVIWLDDLRCTGSEYYLEVCPNLSWGVHNCGHDEDVAIKCSKGANTTLPTTTSILPISSTDQTVIRIELVGGTSELSGRIEIIRNGIRGTVCDDQFDNNDAKVICRMMGYSSGEVIPNIFGQGQGVIWLDDLSCTGLEYDLEVCPNLNWGVHNCGHNEDVAIACLKDINTTTSIPPTSNVIIIELVGGSSGLSGRIEIIRNGIRGTVCDDSFDNNDAKVICRMMGYSSGDVIPNTFGQGQGVIWLDDLSCTGLEYDLEVCPNLNWGVHNCGHNEDVAIACLKDANTTTSIPPTSNVIIIELVGGSSGLSGRIEIIRNGIRGTVCDDSFDNNDAKVICRMMGYSSGDVIPNTFGQGQGVIWLDDLSCTGLEYDLEVCPNLNWGVHNCGHNEDVAIACLKDANTTTSIPPTSNVIIIELVGGSSGLSGRIEIIRNGIRGTVCDDNFDNNDAKVICRMMGYSSGEVISNVFGQGQGTIWLDELDCTGSEYDLEVCPNLSWGVHDCTHREDVAVQCFNEASLTTSIPPTSNLETLATYTTFWEFKYVIDQTATDKCPSGTYSNQTDCIPCPVGEYRSINITGSCMKCPNGTSTHSNGSYSISQCLVTCGRRPIKQSYQRFPGGQVAKYGAFPWQARILKVWFWGKLHHCGAAIINKFWLLTAAHCLKNNLKKENILLQTGDLNSKIWDTHEQSFQVEHLIAHPSYDSLTHDYDVGLIKLQPDRNGNGIVFNDYVQPVCLPPQNLSMSAGTRCEISGWGSTSQTYISVLRAATVPMISRHVCETVHKDITPRMLCAGYLQGGINACQGDHGGPLVCNINGGFLYLSFFPSFLINVTLSFFHK